VQAVPLQSILHHPRRRQRRLHRAGEELILDYTDLLEI